MHIIQVVTTAGTYEFEGFERKDLLKSDLLFFEDKEGGIHCFNMRHFVSFSISRKTNKDNG